MALDNLSQLDRELLEHQLEIDPFAVTDAADFPQAPPAFPDDADARKATQTFAQDYDLLDKACPVHAACEQSLWDQIQACRVAR